MAKEKDILEEVEEMGKVIEKETSKYSRTAFTRYPVTFTLLSVLGFLAVQAGFVNLVAKSQFLTDNPLVLLLIGLLVLIGTGTFYKWLHNKPLS